MAFILSFATIHDALKAEKRAARLAGASLREGALAGAELVPLPPQVKGDCGFGLLIDTMGERALLDALSELDIAFEGIYRIDEAPKGRSGPKERHYERIG